MPWAVVDEQGDFEAHPEEGNQVSVGVGWGHIKVEAAEGWTSFPVGSMTWSRHIKFFMAMTRLMLMSDSAQWA